MKQFYKITRLYQISEDGTVGSSSQLYGNLYGIHWKIYEIKNNNVCKFNSHEDYQNLKHIFKEFVRNDLLQKS